MKKYFTKKTLEWNLIIGLGLSFVYMAVLMLIDAVLGITGANIDRDLFSSVYSAVGTSLMTFLGILSGRIFANYLNKNSEYKGDFNKYQYIYNILATGLAFAVTNLSNLIKEICLAAMGESELVTAVVNPLNSLIFGVLGIVVDVICVRSLLCATVQGEEAEKNYFSKAFLPFTVSTIVAAVAEMASIVIFNTDLLDGISTCVYLAFYICLIALLKYKFDDGKIRKIVCNILPFVYCALCAVFRIVHLIDM